MKCGYCDKEAKHEEDTNSIAVTGICYQCQSDIENLEIQIEALTLDRIEINNELKLKRAKLKALKNAKT